MARRIASRRSPISTAPRAARQDRGADGGGVFAARIVVGDDDAVGFCRGDGAHQRPLAAIAVAAGAEYHDEPAGHVGPQRFERLGERIGLVRIIDEDRRAAARADAFEPALGAGEMFERREHRSRHRRRSR